MATSTREETSLHNGESKGEEGPRSRTTSVLSLEARSEDIGKVVVGRFVSAAALGLRVCLTSLKWFADCKLLTFFLGRAEVAFLGRMCSTGLLCSTCLPVSWHCQACMACITTSGCVFGNRPGGL